MDGPSGVDYSGKVHPSLLLIRQLHRVDAELADLDDRAAALPESRVVDRRAIRRAVAGARASVQEAVAAVPEPTRPRARVTYRRVWCPACATTRKVPEEATVRPCKTCGGPVTVRPRGGQPAA